MKVHGTIRNDDTALQGWNNVATFRSNVTTMLLYCVVLKIVIANTPLWYHWNIGSGNSQTLEARKNHVWTCKLKYDLFIENFCQKLSHYISKFVIFAAILRCNVEPHVTPAWVSCGPIFLYLCNATCWPKIIVLYFPLQVSNYCLYDRYRIN